MRHLEKEWKSYPVMRFDFSRAQTKSSEALTRFIENRLTEYEQEFGIADTALMVDIGDRFGTLIERICKSTGKQVVILIDEYDKGIHEVLENKGLLFSTKNLVESEKMVYFAAKIRICDAFSS